jgi:hypothetical protein
MEVESGPGNTFASVVARHYGPVTTMVRVGLEGADLAHRLLGTPIMEKIGRTARKLSGNRLPLWTPEMPKRAPKRKYENLRVQVNVRLCISRVASHELWDLHGVIQNSNSCRTLLKPFYNVPDIQ